MTTEPATSTGGPLAGRTAIVTGASRGIGEAIVDAFLRAGASRIAAVARSADRLELLAKADERVVPVVADLGVVADVEAAFAAAKEALGRIDVLVNNAGMGWTRRSTKLDAAQLDELYAVNVRSTTLLSIAAAAHMAGAGGGSLGNVSPITATRGAPYLSPYAATKGALAPPTRSRAAEAAAPGVRVDTLCPAARATHLCGGGGQHPRLGRVVGD